MVAPAAIEDRLETDIQALLQTLDLSEGSGATDSITTDRILVQLAEDQLNVPAYPAVIVSCQGEAEEVSNYLSSSENRGTTYPVVVKVVDQARADFQGARSDYLRWRYVIYAALHEQSNAYFPPATAPPLLPHVPECSHVKVKMRRKDEGPSRAHLVVAGLVAYCYCAESPRTG